MVNWKNTSPENEIMTKALNVATLKENPKTINEYAEYQKNLSQIIAKVINAANEISDNLFNLACQGKLKEWDKKQPVGTIIHVTDKMLRNLGDKNIVLLLNLLDEIEKVTGEIIIKPSDLQKMFS